MSNCYFHLSQGQPHNALYQKFEVKLANFPIMENPILSCTSNKPTIIGIKAQDSFK